LSAHPADPPLSSPPVLVCGLGSLGQACLQRLLAFGLPLHGVDLRQPSWRDPELESRLAATLTLGDMRLPRMPPFHTWHANSIHHVAAGAQPH